MNLLSNSLKFTKYGYVMLSIQVQEGNLVIEVRDSGLGIPSTFLPRLFDPFTQAQTRGSQQGTGLGLSIVKRLLDKMGGTIQVESRYEVEPSGTTFTIEIPLETSEPQRHNPNMSAEIPTVVLLHCIRGRTLEGLKLAWELSGYRVMVLEDHRNLQNQAFKYIWVDAEFLADNSECLSYLMDHHKWSVLVPYTEQATLQRLQGLSSAPHLVPVAKPLMWHTFEEKVANAKLASSSHKSLPALKPAISALVSVSNNDRNSLNLGKDMPLRKFQILLVEDNPVGIPPPGSFAPANHY